MIVCSKCGFENQLGHIFCTRCRTKLVFDKLSDKELIKSQEPGRRQWLRLMLVFDVFLVAAIALALWPTSIPSQQGTAVDLQQARRKIALIEKGGMIPPQVFSELELNACLAAALDGQQRSGVFQIRSVQMEVKPNAIVLSVVVIWAPISAGGVRLGPFAITYGITGVPEIGPAGLHFAVSRGMIGHLPLPGPLGLVVAPQVKAHFRGLRQNYPVVGAVRRLELEDGKVIVYAR